MVPRKESKYLPPKPISLKTLGDFLDLSPATISLVLNNAPGVRSIPQKTRDRVIEAAKKFDYRPSFSARSLRSRQTFSIGLLVPELSDGYCMLVMNGVEEVLLEEGYFYLTASHRRKADLVEEYTGLLMERSVEGFIAIDTVLTRPLSLPVVAVAGHQKIEGVTNVVLDHARAADLALRHLHQLGHRNIAFMRGQTFSSDSEDRWKHLMTVARTLDIPVKPELTVRLQVNEASPELGYPPVRSCWRKAAPLQPWCASMISRPSAPFEPSAITACVFRRMFRSSDSMIFKGRRTTTPASQQSGSLCGPWDPLQHAFCWKEFAGKRIHSRL